MYAINISLQVIRSGQGCLLGALLLPGLPEEGDVGQSAVVLLQGRRDPQHHRVGLVVHSGVSPHLLHVCVELAGLLVDVVHDLEAYGLHVDGLADDRVVVGRPVSLLVHWRQER